MPTRITLFSGFDTAGDDNLWVTDGTSGGTRELSPADASSGGIFSPATLYGPDFALLGTQTLFAGISSNTGIDTPTLWVTDGTSVGTNPVSITGADVTGVFASKLNPDITVFGNKAVFEGYDANFVPNLWVTDGTSTGTRELDAAAADQFGFFSNSLPDFTVLGSKVLFAAFGADSKRSLWVTDGTTTGTKELSVAGAPSSGLFGAETFTPDLTVLGSDAVFEGFSTTDLGLWVTNGTGAGTSELKVNGADTSGLFGILNADSTVLPSTYVNPDFTVLGSKVLFAGRDTSDDLNLWVTNGSATGTVEIAVSTAFSGGMFNQNDAELDPDFTPFAGKVVFAGMDAADHPGLWITDGTSTGTSELTPSGAACLVAEARISSCLAARCCSPGPTRAAT